MTLTIHREMLQGSDEWLQARRGMLTASTIGALLTTKPPAATSYACSACCAKPGESCVSIAKGATNGKPVKVPHPARVDRAAENPDDLPDRVVCADSDKSRALVAQIVAERLTDWHDPEWTNGDMERGHQVEPIARDWYSADRKVDVEQVGFMILEKPMPWDPNELVTPIDETTRTWKLGYSPDGLVGDDGLIEIKGPRGKSHVQWFVDVFDGKEVSAHMAQCQTGMYVSGRSWCDFISYLGGEPPLVTRIKADPEWFDAIEKAARHFETKAVEMADKYLTATAGLPKTDRLPDPYDVELKLA